MQPGDVHAWHLFTVEADLDRLPVSRREICQRLEQHGIGTGYHFPAVHSQEYYLNTYGPMSLPHTERLSARIISLPLWPGMTNADVERVIAALTAVAQEILA